MLNPCLCVKKNVGVWKEQDVGRRREGEMMQQEKERETERSEELENKEVTRKWYSYLPCLEPPCRLLPPAFSSPRSSWWRTVTWLHPGGVGGEAKSHRRQSTSVQHVQTYNETYKGRQNGCMLAIDRPTSSIHTTHKDPPKQTEFIGAVKRAKLAHPFK